MNILVTILAKESPYGDVSIAFFKSKTFIWINRWISSEKGVKYPRGRYKRVDRSTVFTLVTCDFITAPNLLVGSAFSVLWLLFKSLIFYFCSINGKKVDFTYINLTPFKYKIISQTWKLITNISKIQDKLLHSDIYSEQNFHIIHWPLCHRATGQSKINSYGEE